MSRPTMREAMIALQVEGLVDVRTGSGTYVVSLPNEEGSQCPSLTAFELSEARLLIEGEVAALAASQATQVDIDYIAALIDANEGGNQKLKDADEICREFHLAVARTSQNGALVEAVDNLWFLRANSFKSAILQADVRGGSIRHVMEEHAAVLDAIRGRDPVAACAAMRSHISSVLDRLLLATEVQAIDEARRATAAQRPRSP